MNIDDLFGKEVIKVGLDRHCMFCAEEVVAYAIIDLVFPNVQLIRTKNMFVLQNVDILLGMKMPMHEWAFDRCSDDINYISIASAVWEKFGHYIVQKILDVDCKHIETAEGLIEVIWKTVNLEYIINIDSPNNLTNHEPSNKIAEVLALMNLPCSNNDESDKQFDIAVSIAKNWLVAVIIRKYRCLRKIITTVEEDYCEASKIFEKCGDIAVFNKENKALVKVYTDFCNAGKHVPKLIIFPFVSGSWQVMSYPQYPSPERWCGQYNFVTEGGTKVDFIHPAGIIGGTKTKEEAIALAEEWLKG